MAKVLVTGGNGFLGAWLIRHLLQEGHEVSVLVRKTSDLSALQGLSCQYVYGDVSDLSSLQAAFKNQETVFHLAGLIAYKKADRDKMEKINVQGTANVIQAMVDNHVEKLVHISSVVAIGAGLNDQQILNEESAFNVHDYNLGYFETKKSAEELVVAATRENKIKSVILNPSTIYGAGDARKGSRKTQLKVARGKFPLYTSGGVNVVSVEDVVKGILSAWRKGRNGERYILSSENLRIKELFKIIAEEAGVAPPRFKMPDGVLFFLGWCGDLLSTLGKSSSLSLENYYTATMFHWFDCAKARQELDFNPRPAREAIRASVRWSKEKGLLS